MKIALVLDDTLDSADGVQQYVLTVGRELSRRGHEVHYLAGHTTRTDVAHIHSLTRTIGVRFNGNRMRTPLPARTATLRALLERESFDVIHVQAPYSPLLAGRIIRLASAQTRVVTTFHVAPFSPLVKVGNRLLALVTRRSGNRVDSWIAVSSVAAQFAQSTYHRTCDIVPNPVDTALAARWREETRPADRPPTVVYLGRLVARKGPDLLLRAVQWAQDHDTLPASTRVIMVGDGPMRAQLEAQAATLDTEVRFVGSVSEENKFQTLAGADVAVFPATGGESFGIVLPEAMAAGARVIIAGDNPGYASTMAGSHGQLVDPHDAAALGARIGRGLTDASFMQACGAYQDKRLAQFDVKRVVDGLERHYR